MYSLFRHTGTVVYYNIAMDFFEESKHFHYFDIPIHPEYSGSAAKGAPALRLVFT